jgi:hypothetical protein
MPDLGFNSGRDVVQKISLFLKSVLDKECDVFFVGEYSGENFYPFQGSGTWYFGFL